MMEHMSKTKASISRRACLGMMASTLAGCRAPMRGMQSSSGGEIAITIDDLDVNADDTPRLNLERRNEEILAALRAAELRAAVFVCGMRVDNPQGKRHLAQWSHAGHWLCNHSYSHWSYPRSSFEQFSADVLRGQAVIEPYDGFRKWFRFPYLKEGATAGQRDRMRTFLKEHGYRMGYVTVDASDWAIDARLRKRLGADPQADLEPFRRFYLEHIWDRTLFYDGLARQVLNRTVKHTLLIHHNLLAALFLPDLIRMYAQRGWRLIDAGAAFEDPVFSIEPDVLPAGESILWSLAKQSGRVEHLLRYPAEDEIYERARMDELGL
jgi:peptidoglycan/xylan/chitin deacetylase (PgdA/CDA1 family)